MNIILLGPPGAGKGTQADFICKEFNVLQISTGDILRQTVKSGSKIGKKLATIINSGILVPDEMIIEIIEEKIAQPTSASGFLFDGFPRTIQQAQALHKSGVDIHSVIDLKVNDDEIIKRMSGRLIHPGSGRIYHIHHNPPKIENIDDITGENLVQREDDYEDVVRKRLGIYHEQTSVLSKFYQEDNRLYHEINGMRSVDAVWGDILYLLNP